jgi:hypothetical protein
MSILVTATISIKFSDEVLTTATITLMYRALGLAQILHCIDKWPSGSLNPNIHVTEKESLQLQIKPILKLEVNR